MDTPVPPARDAPLGASIAALGADLRAGRIRASELTETVLARIATLEPSLGAYITVDASGARAAARRADDDLRQGRDRGPLHGIPIGLKDLIDTASLPTTAGSRVLAERIPRRSAMVARRLRAAGAVTLGKLAMTEFATGSSDQPAIGRTHNPWDLTRIPGGSSSGSAVAVAAGLAVAAIGTDTGGSVRSPAALCGVVGIRPTRGRVPTSGVLPLSRSFDTVGPLARSVHDVGIVLAVVGSLESTVRAALIRPPDPSQVRGRVVGCLIGEPWSDIDADVAAATEAAVRALVAAGARRTDVRLSGVAQATGARRVVQYAEAAAVHATWSHTRAADYDPTVLELLRFGERVTPGELAVARRVLARFRRGVRERFGSVDLLVSASVPRPAWTFDEAAGSARLAGFALTAPVTAMGLPALSVPSGVSAGGLPLGLQVVGRSDEEPLLLAAASVVEAWAGGPRRLPVTPAIR